RPGSDEAPDASASRGNHGDDQERNAAQTVSFATRAYPFLEMLRAAQKSGADIAWGI
ncbi:MAG: DUF1840 family protein, partial [Burkholderiaceae bacterium]